MTEIPADVLTEANRRMGQAWEDMLDDDETPTDPAAVIRLYVKYLQIWENGEG